jgi:hypothetical protein
MRNKFVSETERTGDLNYESRVQKGDVFKKNKLPGVENIATES